MKTKKLSDKLKTKCGIKGMDRLIENVNKEKKERIFVKLNKRLSEMSDEDRNW